ncbi:hypothetical protein Hypma_001059 [Hypsizygus marmoreus]|uniref:Uncharacterized protein n=1 Tax=Hypsizygus marmoreus TaxID=39966 RepID=A0A369J6P6_HYPMA|nr:hypothetical protein Hypma_001059 [Hypsizygus marmoreus]
MFSSIASFLPSLHLNPSSTSSIAPTPPPFDPADNALEEEAYKHTVEEEVSTKKETSVSKTRSANETFIFVRPPPAKSNHPLNLQVQLVPPAPRNQRQSLDEPETPVPLARTSSNRSDTSSYGSTASFSSTSSTFSGRRTIIPLYSLQAHNVMTNTIVDAGTDAKIAKFQRRGIELIDLAVLEPVEVWGEKARPAKSSRPVTPDVASTTAGSSIISLSSNSHAQPSPTIQMLQPTQPPSSKRNLFGKMFKKSGKDSTPPVSPATSTFPSNTTPTQTSSGLRLPSVTTPTPNRTANRHSRNISATLSPTGLTGKLRNRSSSPNPQTLGSLQVPSQGDANVNANNSSITDLTSAEEKILRPLVLGIQPTLSFSYTPSLGATPAPVPISSISKSARALMYVWFVRKWLKRRADDEDSSLFGMVRGSKTSTILSGSSATDAAGEGVEVRFEWKRSGKSKSKRGRDRDGERRGRKSGTEPGESGKGRDKLRELEREKMSNRLSVISHQSISTNMSASDDGHGHSPLRKELGGTGNPRSGTPTREKGKERDRRASFGASQEDDDGDDSEPEDSETPWVCTLKIRRTGNASSLTRSRGSGSTNGLGGSVTEGSQPRDEMGVLTSTPQVLRVKVGTLLPTPHHPKVVALLKVPFPLPDIEIERMGVNRRPMGESISSPFVLAKGTTFHSVSKSLIILPTTSDMYSSDQPYVRPPLSRWGGTTLTAEEIKDVVCSTGMWLVVREGFGGVGKVSRKGDGWRIRA